MADERKRIIEQTASTEIFDDDWFIKDSALHNTTKISQTVLKQEILKDVKGVVELTQAEYDALPSSKLTDGILYAIKDSEDIIGNIENAIDTLSGDIDDLEELVSTEMYNTAPMWSGSSYTFDDLVVYGIDGRLYRCIVRNSTANQFVSSEWQATDIKAELYLLLQRIAPQFIASSQSYTQVYYKGNLVLHTNYYGVNTFYVCKQDLPQGDTEWVENHWEEVNTVSGLSKYLMDKIAEAGQIDDVQVKTTGDYESVVDENKVAKIDLSNMLIEKSVPNLPQPIATFSDGSDLPLKELNVAITPQQDLHGYDSPWAGGAGKNKCPTPIADNVVYINGEYAVTLAFNNGNITFTTSANISTYFLLKAFTITSDHVGKTFTMSYSASPSLDDAQCILVLKDGDTRTNLEKTATITADMVGKDLTLRFYKYGIGTYNISNVQLEIGSSATSYAPYSNICPISGWSGCKVGNLGSKNWYDTRQSLLAGYLNGDGTAGGTGQSINKHTEKIPIKGGITYTYSVAVSRNADQVCLWYDKNNNVIDGFVLLKNTTSITAQAPINAVSASLTVYNVDGQTIQLEAGSQATAYEPYNPNSTTYTIPFLDSQGESVEVFGGSVDVVNGGENPSILKKIDLGSLSWVYDARFNGFRASKTDYKKFSGVVPNGCCEIYNMVSNSYFLTNNPNNAISFGVVGGYDNNILIRDTRYTDATEFKTAVTGKYLCYELATPTTFYTQPTSIKSLDGENNVFASTGDVTQLEYIANATNVIANLEARVTALENQ